jgi:ATP-binding cassette subfamily E protein 1
MFDEPSSYLDVKQRLKAASTIRSLLKQDKFVLFIVVKHTQSINIYSYVVVVEHDLAVLDYLSDFICLLYGVPGAYGVVTLPMGCREGINTFLDGFIATENMRFRETQLSFKVRCLF